MYQVLARKWRPQSFDQLVGQGHVARTLSNAIQSDRLAHAYIFAGLRGTGKTTVARILAKCLNCDEGPTTTPCQKCPACLEITESRAMDVLEVDAASRTKVDQTRELLEVVSYAPVRDRNKILIIDEAHMLSKASFNALLKTLEEPPPNVLFVLATTEIQKIIPTILSRCQVFEFRRVAARELADYLRKVCDEEKIRISDAALDRLARSGEGSVRDSLSALERAVAFCGQEVADEDLLRMLGAVRAEVLTELVRALAARDAAAMLTVLDGLVDEGHDLVHFWNELVGALRDLLLLRALPDRKELLSRSADEALALERAAEPLADEDLTRIFQIVADLEPGLKSSSQPRFLFEATLIRLAGLGAVRPIEEVLRSLGSGAESTPAVPARTPQKKNVGEPPPPEAPHAGLASELVSALHDSRPMLGAMLGQASEVELSGGRLLVRFAPGMEALKRQLEQREGIGLLREHAERLARGPVEVRIELEEAGPDAAPAEPPPSEPAAAASAPKPDPRPARPASGPAHSLLDDARREPGVERLLETFGAQVVEIGPADVARDPAPDGESAGAVEDVP